MEEILPGVWHWVAEHPRIHQPVSSYYLEDAGAALDPLLPEGGLDAFGDWEVSQIILTCRHHRRHSAELRERFGARVRVPRNGLHEFEGAGLDFEPYDPGDEVAPGVRAQALECIAPDDEVLHIHAGRGALAFGDGLHRMTGEVAFMPPHLMDEPERVKAETLVRLRDLLELDFDALLFAHGEPLTRGGRDALEAFIERESRPAR
jgi:glyoxylase-like metal-dependent hydrolase (beta-lactamase superfamily II)